MNYAIIAAGEGARLAEEGSSVPKPLVKLNGMALIDRLIDIFLKNEAEEIHIIINESSSALRKHLEERKADAPIRLVVKSTPDSLHSFGELIPQLNGRDVCLTTVDTVFNEDEFSEYVEAFRANKQLDAMAAVTTFVDDEKPLYVSTSAGMDITAFRDDNSANDCKFISGGIYCLRKRAFDSAINTLNEGKSRMRDFQRRMVSDGLNVKAWNFSKIVDVDHIHDIHIAEEMLRQYSVNWNSNT